MVYVFYNKEDNQLIGQAKDIRKALELFDDTINNAVDIKNVNCMIFDDNADLEHDQPDQVMDGYQFEKRAQFLGAMPIKADKEQDPEVVKPVSNDKAGILKNLSMEEQIYVIGRVPDQMLLDELDRRMNSYNSTLDKILGNIKGLEVRI